MGPTVRPEERFLVIVEYQDEAERKRAEYILFQKAPEGSAAERPKGLVALVAGPEVEGMRAELMAKVAPDRVHVYPLGQAASEVAPARASFKVATPRAKREVLPVVEFLLAKRKALFKRGAAEGAKTYELYTRKGRAEVTFEVREAKGRTELSVTVEGLEPALSFVLRELEQELRHLEAA